MREEKNNNIGDNEDVQFYDEDGKRYYQDNTAGLQIAKNLGLTRKVIFQTFSNCEKYECQQSREILAYKQELLKLGEMTPAYAHSMVWADLKAQCANVHFFKDEINLAKQWKEKLYELGAAFNLSEDHFFIDTSGPILHVYPNEESGKTKFSSGHLLHFETLVNGKNKFDRYGRGFEAILPTHVQSTGYATPPHPEMDSSVSAKDAIPSLHIGKYVRISGHFNPQGSERWVFEDNSWLGQGSSIVSQEHPAEKPSHLARDRAHTSFPGMHIGAWAWIAKQAQVLYRTGYIGEGAVVASYTKVNTWVSDYSLVTNEGHREFYPVKSFILNTLGIRETRDVLALDWKKVEDLWSREYEEWLQKEHIPDAEVIKAICNVRKKPGMRVLFLGSQNEANIIKAASIGGGDFPLKRIDVMTINQKLQAFVMQYLNNIDYREARFRKVNNLDNIPIGQFYEGPKYDLVIVEVPPCSSERYGKKEAQRLLKVNGEIVSLSALSNPL